MFGQIAVPVVQLCAIALAVLRGRQDRPLRVGLVIGLLLADLVLPIIGIIGLAFQLLLIYLNGGMKNW